MKLLKLLTLLIIVNPAFSYAQGHSGVGGGDASASDFQNYINKIDSYLLTEEGRTAFPEIKQPAFHNRVAQVRPVVKDERVYDSFGVAQTCVSFATKGVRYFQCDLGRLPKVELNNQPTLYRLTFHELLFQAGMELPISQKVPSNFAISSRLQLRLETFQAWIPGVQIKAAIGQDSNVDSCKAQKFLASQNINPKIAKDPNWADPRQDIGSCRIAVQHYQEHSTISLSSNGVKIFLGEAKELDDGASWGLPDDGLMILKATLFNCGCSQF